MPTSTRACRPPVNGTRRLVMRFYSPPVASWMVQTEDHCDTASAPSSIAHSWRPRAGNRPPWHRFWNPLRAAGIYRRESERGEPRNARYLAQSSFRNCLRNASLRPALAHGTARPDGRLAQLVEHLVYTERVGGSSPSPPTTRENCDPPRALSLRISWNRLGPNLVAKPSGGHPHETDYCAWYRINDFTHRRYTSDRAARVRARLSSCAERHVPPQSRSR